MKTELVMGHHLNEEIYNRSIDDIKEKYNSQKGKRFIEHLIKSFLPINPLNRIYEFGNDTDKNCCISGFRLASIKEMIDAARLSGVDESYIKNMDIICTEEGDKVYSESIENYNKDKDKKKRIYKNIKEKDFAFSSDTSSRVLSTEALLALEKFAEDEIKSGNKSIKFLLNKNKRVVNSKPIGNNKKEVTSQQLKPKKKVEKKVPTNQFSSFDELLNLKKRLEESEK